MLIARAPMRVSFGGGGTDLPSYYERYGGLVVSSSIAYYVYAILTPGQPGGVQVTYAGPRAVSLSSDGDDLIWDSDLGLPKAIAYHFNMRDGLAVFLASQVPPGTGLGLSGSVAVSMIKALAFCCGLDLGPTEVAELACYIEIEKMGMPVGKQDPYAAAFGGLNCITLSSNSVVVEPLRLPPGTREALERGLMLFFVGASCRSSGILRCQERACDGGDRETLRRLGAIKELGAEIRVALERGDLEGFGALLHRSWMEKRELTEGITNPALDGCYDLARENGALGGKVTGAGGGGFLLLYCPEERQRAVVEALAAEGAQRWPISLEDEGVQVMQAMPWSRQPVVSAGPWSQVPAMQRMPLTVQPPGTLA